ncbi:MAG: hypothetical protein WBF83_06225 [Moheibacter sp.]
MQLNLRFDKQVINPAIVDESSVLTDLNLHLLSFPSPDQELLPGLNWGGYDCLFTPAYWKMQYLMHYYDDAFNINYKLGSNIFEEVVACLLGGFGLKSEMGLAAFHRLKNRSLIKRFISFEAIHTALKEPFFLKKNMARYRFPNQKAKFISEFLNRYDLDMIPSIDLELRDWLMSVNGIGPKTASWITRNHLDSEKVAIIDVHILRALHLMGVSCNGYDVQKNYFELEHIFLYICKELEVQPSKMDALIWLQMKESNKVALKIFNNHYNRV